MRHGKVIVQFLKKLLNKDTQLCSSPDRYLNFTDLPVELQRLVMNYLDIASFLNFLRIPSTTVQNLRPTRRKITSPEDLHTMKPYCSSSINISIAIVVIDRVDSWDFDRLIWKVNVTGCTALVVLRGKEPIQAYASRLLGEILTSNCALYFESDEAISTISINNARIHCERIDLKGLPLEKKNTTKVVFSNCSIDKHLALLGPNCDFNAKKEYWKFYLNHIGVELEIQGCSQSFLGRLEVIEPAFCTSLALNQDPAQRLVLRDELFTAPVFSLDIQNVASMERCTINSSIVKLQWSCDYILYETSCLPDTPLITNICSTTLKQLFIDSNIDGVSPVVTEINAPNLKSVSLGDLDDKFTTLTLVM